jgi:uncharacterized protein DUF4424
LRQTFVRRCHLWQFAHGALRLPVITLVRASQSGDFRGLAERLLIRYLWAMPPRPKDKLCKKSRRRPARGGCRSLCTFAAAALIGCIITPPGNALANDSEAAIGIGGLVLRKNAHVEMRSEDLYVSASAIRVRYRFYNKSGSDVSTVIAFPLPELKLDDDDSEGLTEHEFSTRVDGVPVNTQIERRAMVGGRDRTDVLKRDGVPLDGSQLDKSQLDKLPHNTTLKTTYYWKQTFPAKKEITIEHRYRPVVGGTVPIAKWRDMRPGSDLFSYYQKEHCIDGDFVRSAELRERARPWNEKWISYILTTGGNWAGPIGEFRLVVDKGDPSNLASFCADGVKKISPTEFEVRKKNFKPSKDLNVLILTTVQEAD